MFYHLHVRLRPISLAELPHINDITIQNDFFGPDRFQISKKFFCAAAIGAEMNIGNYNEFYVSFSFFTHCGQDSDRGLLDRDGRVMKLLGQFLEFDVRNCAPFDRISVLTSHIANLTRQNLFNQLPLSLTSFNGLGRSLYTFGVEGIFDVQFEIMYCIVEISLDLSKKSVFIVNGSVIDA